MGKVCIAICFHRPRNQTFKNFNGDRFELRNIAEVWIVMYNGGKLMLWINACAKLFFVKKSNFFFNKE